MHSDMNKILIIGNGSGGHFYPSFAVANELKKDNKVYYVVAKDRLDEKIIRKSEFEYLSLPYIGLKRNKLSFLNNQIKNINNICNFIKMNNINLVIGFGGGLSFSSLIAGKMCGCKLICHEQNAILGRANKILKLIVNVFVSHKCLESKSLKFVGNPIVNNCNFKKVEIYDIIIVFGSQGSSSLNKVFFEFLSKYNGKYKILFVCKEKYVFENEFIKVLPFVENLMDYFNRSRLVFTRGGATTLAELSKTYAKVCIIPSPYVINNHQYFNALEFKKEFGANIIKEKELELNMIENEIKKSLDNFIRYNERIKVEKNDYLTLFIKEIKNELQ